MTLWLTVLHSSAPSPNYWLATVIGFQAQGSTRSITSGIMVLQGLGLGVLLAASSLGLLGSRPSPLACPDSWYWVLDLPLLNCLLSLLKVRLDLLCRPRVMTAVLPILIVSLVTKGGLWGSLKITVMSHLPCAIFVTGKSPLSLQPCVTPAFLHF